MDVDLGFVGRRFRRIFRVDRVRDGYELSFFFLFLVYFFL